MLDALASCHLTPEVTLHLRPGRQLHPRPGDGEAGGGEGEGGARGGGQAGAGLPPPPQLPPQAAHHRVQVSQGGGKGVELASTALNHRKEEGVK